jgi:hypothetical protein
VAIGLSWLGHRLANFLDRPTQADSILNSLYISALAGQRDRSSLVLSGAKSLTPDHPMTNSAACATIGARRTSRTDRRWRRHQGTRSHPGE